MSGEEERVGDWFRVTPESMKMLREERARLDADREAYARVVREREARLRQVALAVVLVLTAVMVAIGWGLLTWALN